MPLLPNNLIAIDLKHPASLIGAEHRVSFSNAQNKGEDIFTLVSYWHSRLPKYLLSPQEYEYTVAAYEPDFPGFESAG